MKRILRFIFPVFVLCALGAGALLPSAHFVFAEVRERDALTDENEKGKSRALGKEQEQNDTPPEHDSVVGGIMRMLFGTPSTDQYSAGASQSAGTTSTNGASSTASTSEKVATTTKEQTTNSKATSSVATPPLAASTSTASTTTPLPVSPTSSSSVLGRTIGLYPGALVWLPKSIVNPYQFETLSALWTGRLYTVALLLALFGTALVTGLLDRVLMRREAQAAGAFFSRMRQ